MFFIGQDFHFPFRITLFDPSSVFGWRVSIDDNQTALDFWREVPHQSLNRFAEFEGLFSRIAHDHEIIVVSVAIFGEPWDKSHFPRASNGIFSLDVDEFFEAVRGCRVSFEYALYSRRGSSYFFLFLFFGQVTILLEVA